MHPDVAIAGLGITEMGKVYGRSAPDFAADAVRLAVADAGLTLDDVDGLLINPGLSGGLDIGIAARLGLYNLPLLSVVNAYGSTASVMVMMASLAIAAGPGDHGRVCLRRRDVDPAQPHRRGVRRRWRCRPSVQGHPRRSARPRVSAARPARTRSRRGVTWTSTARTKTTSPRSR